MAVVAQISEARERRAERVARAEEPWVSKRQIAQHFGVTPRTVENWMSKRGMPFEKPYETGNVRFRVSECDEWFGGAA